MQVEQRRAREHRKGMGRVYKVCLPFIFLFFTFLLMLVHSSTPPTPSLAPEHVEHTPRGMFNMFRAVFYFPPRKTR